MVKKSSMGLAKENGYFQNALETDNLSREEVAIVICNLLSISPIDDNHSNFLDFENGSIWAKGYVCALEKKQIIKGYPDMTYKPQKNITKAEFVTLLNCCTGVGGNELEIIDKENEYIEIGIQIYEEENLIIMPIEENILLKYGDKITLALILMDGMEEDDIEIQILDKKVIDFDKETLLVQL